MTGIAWNQLRNERLGIEPAVDKVLRERKEAAQLKENLRLADDALKQATDFGKTEDEAGEGQGEQKSEAKGLLDPLFEFKNSFVSVDRRKEMIEQARELAEERLQDEIDGYGTVEGLDGKRLGFFRKLWRRMKRDTYIEKYTALIAANPEDFLAPDDPAEAKAERDALVRQALEETKREYDLLESPEHRLETSTGVDGELKQLLMQALAGSISNEEYRARLDAYRDKNGDIDNIDEIYGEASAMLDSALATKVYDEATALAKIDLALDRIRVVQAEKLGERGEAKRAEVDRIANLLRKNRKPRMKEFEQPVAEAGAMLTAMAQEIDQLDAIENSPNALIHFDTRTSRARAMLLAMEARVSWVGNNPELIDNASDDDLDRKVLQLRGAIDRLSAKLAVVDAMAQMMRDYEERYQEAVAVGSTEPRRSPAEIYNVVKQNLNLTDQDIVNQFRGMFDAGVVSYRAGFIRRIHAAEQGERVNRARTSSGAEANKPKQYETPAPAVQPEEVVQTEESAPVEPEQPAVVTTEESTPVKPERPTADTKAVNPNTVKPNLPSQENRRTNFAAKNGFDPRAGRGQYFLPGANFAPAAPNNYYAQPAANYAPLQYTFNYVPYPMYTVYPQMMPQGFTPNVLPPPATPNAYQPNQFTPEQARELFQQLLPVFQPMIDELVQAAVSKALAERNNSAAESQPEPGQAEEASEAAAA